jgi:hypothetical protein
MKLSIVTDFFGRTVSEARAPESGVVLYIRAVPNNVSKLGAGYVFDFLRAGPLVAGAGAFGSLNFVARELESLYGELPKSYGFYVRVALR